MSPPRIDPDNTIFDGETIVAVYAGFNNTSMARTASGKLFGWGRSPLVGISRFIVGSNLPRPELITSPDIDGQQVKVLSRQVSHNLALLQDGNLLSFGSLTIGTRPFGAFGTGNTGTGEALSDYPAQVAPKLIPDFTLLAPPIPTTNLALHLDAGRGVNATDNAVSSWRNLAFNGFNVAQSEAANRPVQVEEAINDNPAIRFNGSTSYLNLPTASQLGIQNADYELFIVAQSSSSNIQFLMAGQTLGEHELHLNGAAGARFIPLSNPANFVDLGASGDFTNGTAKLLNVQATDASGRLSVNRTLATFQSTNSHSPNGAELYLGRRTDNSFFLDGDIAEIIIYTGQLTNSDREFPGFRHTQCVFVGYGYRR